MALPGHLGPQPPPAPGCLPSGAAAPGNGCGQTPEWPALRLWLWALRTCCHFPCKRGSDDAPVHRFTRHTRPLRHEPHFHPAGRVPPSRQGGVFLSFDFRASCSELAGRWEKWGGERGCCSLQVDRWLSHPFSPQSLISGSPSTTPRPPSSVRSKSQRQERFALTWRKASKHVTGKVALHVLSRKPP